MNKILKNTTGATAIEWALIAALVALVSVGAMRSVGTNVSKVFNTIANHLCVQTPNQACSGG